MLHNSHLKVPRDRRNHGRSVATTKLPSCGIWVPNVLILPPTHYKSKQYSATVVYCRSDERQIVRIIEIISYPCSVDSIFF